MEHSQPAAGDVLYRCSASWCRSLVRGEPGLEGQRHEECGAGLLTEQATVTTPMIRDHEVALDLADITWSPPR
jgi:hypothetical protein